MNPIAAASQAARAAKRQVRGETVVYTRGAVSLVVTAVRGETQWETSDAYDGIQVGDRSTDWIIEVSALVSSGTQWTPTRGDEITVDGITFRPMPFGADKQVWQYHDRQRMAFRVHTKERV